MARSRCFRISSLGSFKSFVRLLEQLDGTSLPLPERLSYRLGNRVMKMSRLALLLSLVVSVPAAAQSIDATLDRGLRAYNSARTTKATFEQMLSNPLTGSSSKARGELLMRRPNQLSVKFTDPSGDRIVADGGMLWVYLPSQN